MRTHRVIAALVAVAAVGTGAVLTTIASAPISSPSGTRGEPLRPRPEPGAPANETDVGGAVFTGAVQGALAAGPSIGARAAIGARPVSGAVSVAARPSSGGASTPQSASPNVTSSPAPPTSGRDECIAEGGEVGVDTPGAGGAGTGLFWPECDYTARSAAGYIANGNWRITVTKPDGTVNYYGPGDQPPLGNGPQCGKLGVVQPGDRVHVELAAGAENAANEYYVKVGPKYHC